MAAGVQQRVRRSARLRAVGIAALGGFVFHQASRMTNFGSDPGSPGIFPALVAAVLVACAVSIWREDTQAVGGGTVTATALIAVLMATLYGALLKPLGFVSASLIYLVTTFLWLRAAPWWKSLVAAVVAVAVTFVVFRHVFLVILP